MRNVITKIIEELRIERERDYLLIQSGKLEIDAIKFVLCRMSVLDAVASSIERALNRAPET